MQLAGQKREILGKKVKYLRDERLLPGVIFGRGLESLPITVNYNDFIKIFKKVGETSVFDLMVDGKKHPVLVKDIQLHHVTSRPTHVGFYEVDLTEKINADIPVEVINEEQNDLVKSGEALVLLVLNEIEVEALPNDLPDKFVVDVSGLQDIDSAITVDQLNYDKEKVEIVDIEPDEVVVKLDYAQMLEEEEEEEIDEAEALAEIEATEEKDEAEEGEEEEKQTQPQEETDE